MLHWLQIQQAVGGRPPRYAPPRPATQVRSVAASLSQAGRAASDRPIRAIQPAGRTPGFPLKWHKKISGLFQDHKQLKIMTYCITNYDRVGNINNRKTYGTETAAHGPDVRDRRKTDDRCKTDRRQTASSLNALLSEGITNPSLISESTNHSKVCEVIDIRLYFILFISIVVIIITIIIVFVHKRIKSRHIINSRDNRTCNAIALTVAASNSTI